MLFSYFYIFINEYIFYHFLCCELQKKKLGSIFKLFKVFDLPMNQIEYFCGLDVSDTCNKNRIRFLSIVK